MIVLFFSLAVFLSLFFFSLLHMQRMNEKMDNGAFVHGPEIENLFAQLKEIIDRACDDYFASKENFIMPWSHHYNAPPSAEKEAANMRAKKRMFGKFMSELVGRVLQVMVSRLDSAMTRYGIVQIEHRQEVRMAFLNGVREGLEQYKKMWIDNEVEVEIEQAMEDEGYEEEDGCLMEEGDE
uniref:Uncharacterized protein n=1 Tax=Strigamia maritima TaxID=126957 RepID=T1JAH9_STRMM